MNNLHANALLQSIRDAPLLVGDLSEAASFDRALLGMPTAEMRPNANQKLGHLYEDALHLLLSASDQLEVLADHLQVFDRNQITLGEMDYILRDVRTQQVFQLELAVKFYLGDADCRGLEFPRAESTRQLAAKTATHAQASIDVGATTRGTGTIG